MTDDVELSRVLTATLKDRAGQVTVPADTFDPGRRAAWALEPGPPRRSWVRAAAAAAAAIALVAGVAVVVRAAGPDGSGVSTEGDPATAPAMPEGVLAPATPPEGLDLWGISLPPRGQADADDTMSADVYPEWSQLFGDPADPTRLLLVEAYWSQDDVGDTSSSGSETVTVRGQQRPVVANPPYSDGAFGIQAVHWEEAGLWYAAMFKGMTPAEVATTLDGLRSRPEDGRGTFDPPADGSFTLLDQAFDRAPVEDAATFTYAEAAPSNDSAPEGRLLNVMTTPGPGSTTVHYLRTWLDGTRHADGTVSSYLAEPDGSLVVIHPDGSQVATTAWGTGVPQAVAERVAASVRPTAAEELGTLWTEANDRVSSLPVITEIELPSGTLHIRGDGGEPRALCLQVEAGVACPGIGAGVGTYGGQGELVASLQLGDTWYVAAATTGAPPAVDDRLGAETGSEGTWNFLLVQPGDGIDDVTVSYEGGDHAVDLDRP